MLTKNNSDDILTFVAGEQRSKEQRNGQQQSKAVMDTLKIVNLHEIVFQEKQ